MDNRIIMAMKDHINAKIIDEIVSITTNAVLIDVEEASLHKSCLQTQKLADRIPLISFEFSTHSPSMYLLPSRQLLIVVFCPCVPSNQHQLQ